MTVREYIGARYVPLFMGEWDSTVAYEPLSVVQYQGNSYTSRQAVPVGIPITDETYWASTGNYNAQIEAYRQEVVAYNARITANEEAIADINDEIDVIESDSWVTTNRVANSAITEDKLATDSVGYNEIKANSISPGKLNADTVKRFWAPSISSQGTNMVVFGDSYTAPGIANSLDAYWPKRVASTLSLNLFNYAIAGAGFGRTAQLISRQQTNCENAMTEDEAKNTSLVICMAGCNDLLNDVSNTDINNGIRGFMSWASSFFPYAQIFVIPFNWGFGNLTKERNVQITNCLNSVMTYNNPRIHFVPFAWTWNLGIASRFQNDVHPNTSGYNQIAARVLNMISGVESGVFNSGNINNFENHSQINSGYLEYNMREGVLYVNGYIRPTNAGAQNIAIYGEGKLAAICTPVNSLFVLPLIDSTNHQVVGNITFNSDGRLVANLLSSVAANDVCCFNGSFIPEVGVNWSDYN